MRDLLLCSRTHAKFVRIKANISDTSFSRRFCVPLLNTLAQICPPPQVAISGVNDRKYM